MYLHDTFLPISVLTATSNWCQEDNMTIYINFCVHLICLSWNVEVLECLTIYDEIFFLVILFNIFEVDFYIFSPVRIKQSNYIFHLN
jgi:hypothetical protein